MNRSRKVNRGLPRRVYLVHGAYRYFSPVPIRDPRDGKYKKWIHLAYDYEGEEAMYAARARLPIERTGNAGSMPHVCEEYRKNRLGRYGKDTQAQYGHYLDVIAAAFKDLQAAHVTTKQCADFLRHEFGSVGKHNTAQKVAALMRKLFKYVISSLGLRHDNPIDQLDLSDYGTGRRTFIPTHEQVRLIREHALVSKPRSDTGRQLPNLSGPMLVCIIDMTYLCWARAVDVRTLRESQITDGKIRLRPSKTSESSGKAVDIVITPDIQRVIDRAREIKKTYGVSGRGLESPYLFPARNGNAYSKGGLFSLWKRACLRAGIPDDVQFRDLRALGATDAARAGETKDEIRKRLVHTSSKTSEIYIKDVIPETSELEVKLPW